MTWHDIRDPNDPLLDELARQYNLAPAAYRGLPESQSGGQNRADERLSVHRPQARRHGQDHTLQIADLDFFIGKDWIITVQEHQCENAAEALNKVKQNPKLRPDEIFYRVMDTLWMPISRSLTVRVIVSTRWKIRRSRIPTRQCSKTCSI